MLFSGMLLFNDQHREVFIKLDMGGEVVLVIQTSQPGNPMANAYATLGGTGSNTPSRHDVITGRLIHTGQRSVAIDLA